MWKLRAVFGEPMSQTELSLFFEQFATLLASGAPIGDSLLRASRFAGAELQHICAAAARKLSAGVPLSRAIAPWKHRLPEIVLPVLEVGEVSGTLESACRRLAYAFHQGAAIDKKIRYSVFDPKIVIAVIALDIMSHGLYSSLAEMFQRGLTVAGQMLAFYVIGRLVLRALFRWRPLHIAIDTLKLAIPDIGVTLRYLAAARWARSFATLWNSGVAIGTALEVSSRSALNAHFEQAIVRAARQVRTGRSLRDSLAETQFLPRHLLEIIATGELTGKLGDSLAQFVELLEAEAFARASRQFVFILMAGQIIGFLLAFMAIFHG